jgi:precorrin-6Y C5,15-methyltransferase (decarboxylating)
MSEPWLTIVGIGEDGPAGLSLAASRAIRAAGTVFGGARHLALAGALIGGETVCWPNPLEGAFPAILARRPRPVVVLASGDPFWFGIGVRLAGLVPMAELRCLPAPSCFALACARLGWSLPDCATISFCGRPLEPLRPLLQPGARILALSADATTPDAVAARLRGWGFGASRLRVLEALGGPRERIADYAEGGEVGPLNMLAIEVAAAAAAWPIPLASGLADDAFEHDGQLTKREIRAVTLSALAPRRAELLWDIGCGSGAIGIEWLLRHPANRAVAVEARPDRAARAARNAAALGVPHIRIVGGAAPAALVGLPSPDAVFIGGGAHEPGLIDAAWAALAPDGRLVVNAVTVETEAALIAAQARLGGTLTRIGIERLGAVGGRHGFRPAMTVTQFAAVKP